jgi:hypothetical protein
MDRRPLPIVPSIIGALALPIIAIVASFYGASVGIGVEDHVDVVRLLSPAILLAGLYLFPVTLAAVAAGWLASFVPAGLWFLARQIPILWARVVVSVAGASVVIALGTALGMHLIGSSASFPGDPPDPSAPAVDAGTFIATFALCVLLVGATSLMTNLIGSRRELRAG